MANASEGEGGTGGNLIVSHGISAAGDAFQVAADAAVTALSYIAGTADDAVVSINIGAAGSEQSTFKQPVEVEAEGDCSYSDDTQTITGNCALKVKGNSVITGDMTIGKSFSAKDLHARQNLTVGQNSDGSNKGKTLSVTTTEVDGVNTDEFNFGNGALKMSAATVEGTSANRFNWEDYVKMGVVAMVNGEGGTSVLTRAVLLGTDINPANFIAMRTASSGMEIENDTIQIRNTNESGVDFASNEAWGRYILAKSNSIILNDLAFRIMEAADGESIKNSITSEVKSFKITPEGNDATGSLDVRNRSVSDSGSYNVVDIDKLETVMTDGNQYMRNGAFHLQKGSTAEGATAYSDALTMKAVDSLDAGGNPAAQLSGDEIYMKGIGTAADNVVKFDLANTTTTNSSNIPVYIRKGAIELTAGDLTADEGGTRDYNNYVKGEYFVSTKQLENDALINGETETHYQVNPGYTSVMHDIKLTTRGGARLSDILPDFINKGIYVVDNTYPAKGVTSCGGTGVKLSEYEGKSLATGKGYKDLGGIGVCTSIYQEASPWGGFVPSPTCPPGYSKVITMVPASIAMAQAGIPYSKGDDSYTAWKSHPDLSIPYVVKSPYDYLDGTAIDAAPTPLYYQKNTWLKSFADKYCEGNNCGNSANFRGWDVGMGFIYPYNLYKNYIDNAGGTSGSYAFDYTGDADSSKIIWNMFPVYAGTLEGYATVYCYFNRKNANFNASLIDSEYDQIDNYRNPTVKSDEKANTANYINRLNDNRGRLNAW